MLQTEQWNDLFFKKSATVSAHQGHTAEQLSMSLEPDDLGLNPGLLDL